MTCLPLFYEHLGLLDRSFLFLIREIATNRDNHPTMRSRTHIVFVIERGAKFRDCLLILQTPGAQCF
ncbi:hypothetical protein Plhal304r1_c049g0131651 [Plasmopara halstedii]